MCAIPIRLVGRVKTFEVRHLPWLTCDVNLDGICLRWPRWREGCLWEQFVCRWKHNVQAVTLSVQLPDHRQDTYVPDDIAQQVVQTSGRRVREDLAVLDQLRDALFYHMPRELSHLIWSFNRVFVDCAHHENRYPLSPNDPELIRLRGIDDNTLMCVGCARYNSYTPRYRSRIHQVLFDLPTNGFIVPGVLPRFAYPEI